MAVAILLVLAVRGEVTWAGGNTSGSQRFVVPHKKSLGKERDDISQSVGKAAAGGAGEGRILQCVMGSS